uniref:Uncharacterized protein n=1 Tax=Trichobilharzia regenti TaxID=157069 RepID=A0AA85JAK3_TRIRE
MRERPLELSEGDSQRNVFHDSRKKEETRQGMALNGHLETNRREENGGRENDSMQRRTGEETLSSTNTALGKKVKKSTRKDKRRFYDNLATEADKAAGKKDLMALYQISKSLSGKRSTQVKPIKDSQGNPITKEDRPVEHWAGHFIGLLNRPPPATHPEIQTTARTKLQVDTNPPTKAEVLNANKLLEAGK